MDKIKVILVDDEESARNILKHLLHNFCPNVNLLAAYTNVNDAVEGIKTLKPDLVFLDIEMPHKAGYEIVDYFDQVDFEIVFITAYEKYAIKAFEVSAVDYLLKPIEIERLKESVTRVAQKLGQTKRSESINHLKKTLESKAIKSLIVTQNGYQYAVQIEDIIAIEAQESYSCIHTETKRYLASKNLKHFERLLCDQSTLIRSHKSWIVNLKHMINYSKSDLEINLNGGLTAKLSKYKKADFEAEL